MIDDHLHGVVPCTLGPEPLAQRLRELYELVARFVTTMQNIFLECWIANAGITAETQAASVDGRIVCDSLHRLRRHPDRIAIAFAPMTATGPDFSQCTTAQIDLRYWDRVFSLMFPVLAGYISYSIAQKPGLLTRIFGRISCLAKWSWLSRSNPAGLVSGYVVEALKKVPVSNYLRPIMPILVIPISQGLRRSADD